MLTFTQDEIQTLSKKGITVELHPPTPELMTLEQVVANSFALLNDYPQMGFFFIRFPDEQVPILWEGQQFQCFGKGYYGLFALDERGEVLWFPTNDEYTEASVVWVSESLQQFVRCYSLLLSRVFQLKGADTSTEEQLSQVLNEVAEQLTKDIEHIDPKLLEEGGLWEQLIYMIEDGWFHTAYHEIFYIREGRRSYATHKN